MEQEPNELEKLCRRQWRFRTNAIQKVVDGRAQLFSEAGSALTDLEKLRRDTQNRMLRAQGSCGVERR